VAGSICLFSSCNKDEFSELDQKILDETILTNRTEFEKQLERLSLIFGEIFLEEAARKEFLMSAESNINEGQAQMNLKTLFDSDISFRKHSAIAKALQDGKLKTFRTQEESEDWISFIKANDIKIIAPYLAENFKLEDFNELTVSWWTEEMEIPHLDDPDWEGETPGYKIDLKNEALDDVFSGNSNHSFEKVTANDEYAKVNPTIVLGNFEMPEENDNSFNSTHNLNWTAPNKTPFRCPDLTAGSLFTLRSPLFNLTKNTRGWPNTNYIYMWVVTGDVEYESNGFPKPSSKVEVVLNKKQVFRSQVPDVWIQGNSFLIQNWKYNSDEIAVVWGYYKNNGKLKITGEVKVSDKGTPSGTLKAEYEVDGKGDVELMSRQNFDKCVLLENNFWSYNQGHGFRQEALDALVTLYNYPVYKMGDIKFYYTTTLQKEL
jgi:hypothetical protein